MAGSTLKPFKTIHSGFTLIELLVVMAIFTVLVGLLLPAIQKVRETESRLHCRNNLKQVGLALYAYHNDNGTFPAAHVPGLGSVPTPSGGRSYYSPWTQLILPYIEQGSLSPGPTLATNGYGSTQSLPANYDQPVKLFNCPSDPSPAVFFDSGTKMNWGKTNYVGVSGADYNYLDFLVYFADIFVYIATGQYTPGVLLGFDLQGIFGSTTGIGGITSGQPVGVAMKEVTDGLSNTWMVGERPVVTYNMAYNVQFLSDMFPVMSLLVNPLQQQVSASGMLPPTPYTTGKWASAALWENVADGWYEQSNGYVSPVLGWGVNSYPCPNPVFFETPIPATQYYGNAFNDLGLAYIADAWWFEPPYCDTLHFWSLHPGGGNWLYADGSVRWMSYAGGYLSKALSSMNGGEIVENPW